MKIKQDGICKNSIKGSLEMFYCTLCLSSYHNRVCFRKYWHLHYCEKEMHHVVLVNIFSNNLMARSDD